MTIKRRGNNPHIRHSRMGAWIREGRQIEEPFSNRDRVKQRRDWNRHRLGVMDAGWDSSRTFRYNKENREYLLECFELERLGRIVEVKE